MSLLLSSLRKERGYSAIEIMVVSSILIFVLIAAYNLLELGYGMDRQAEDGFQAQTEGRQVLTQLTRMMRPAEDMNVAGMPVLYAGSDGTFIDLRLDSNNDTATEIVRFDLDTTNKQIKMYIDYPDTTGAQTGKFNFEKTSPVNYVTYYNHPTTPSDWDQVTVLANKTVNAPPISWGAQRSTTDPEKDYRLFTFYGDNFTEPLDTQSLGSTWVNYVKGVKIFLLSDIQPTEIPSPFAVQTNVNLRNISSG